MTDRHYLILGFVYRCGNIYRQDKWECTLASSDNSADVLTVIRAYAAHGWQVLVYEDGFIKADWSRLHQRAYNAIMGMKLPAIKRLFSNTIMPIEVDAFVNRVFHAFENLSRQLPLNLYPEKYPPVVDGQSAWPWETKA